MAPRFLPRSYFRRLALYLVLHVTPIILLLPLLISDLRLMARHNSNIEIHIQVDKISKALWDSDFELMSLVFKQQLPHLLRTCYNINNSKGITIFAPPDNEIYNFQMKYRREVIGLDYQIMTSKFDKEAFELGYPQQTFKLATCNPALNVTVARSSYDPSEGFARGLDIHRGFRITHWDIYNDGFVVVHGIDNFFMDDSPYFSVFPYKSWLPANIQIKPYNPDLS